MPRSMLNTSGPVLGSPRWAGDYRDRDHLVPGGARIDQSKFTNATGITVTLTANAAAAAVALVVAALSGPIPAGTLLDFGSNKFARTTADALAGAVGLTVAAIPTAMVIGDTTTWSRAGLKRYPAGTILGRTRAERDAGTGFDLAADTDEEIYLAAFDFDVDIGDVELYRYNSVVYENFLPTFAAASATIKAFLRDKYVCSIGQV
jgi:hypothetical protein